MRRLDKALGLVCAVETLNMVTLGVEGSGILMGAGSSLVVGSGFGMACHRHDSLLLCGRFARRHGPIESGMPRIGSEYA